MILGPESLLRSGAELRLPLHLDRILQDLMDRNNEGLLQERKEPNSRLSLRGVKGPLC
jgi:hypothetical protein